LIYCAAAAVAAAVLLLLLLLQLLLASVPGRPPKVEMTTCKLISHVDG